MNDDLPYWVGFNMVKGVGPAKLQALHDRFGTLEAAWHSSPATLKQLGIDQRTLDSLAKSRAALNLAQEMEKLERQGVTVLIRTSADYPDLLRDIPNAPPVLYLKGSLHDADRWAVALVGTRQVSAYGRQMTREITRGLVQQGITIVSGLARGIDAIAHETAVETGGRTIAVLGSGLDCIYPAENRTLAARIADGHGAVVSEYALGVQPEAKNFPPRNRIISGLSLGTVVIEAAERSGALITADFAREQGRELFALPGNVTSKGSAGTNRLIQSGARLITGADDVLTELNLGQTQQHQAAQMVLPESAEEAALLPLLAEGAAHIDELSRQSGLPAALVSSTLIMMQLKGMVIAAGNAQYALAR
jgi:DNA processing protein